MPSAQQKVKEYLKNGKELPASVDLPNTPMKKDGTVNYEAVWDELLALGLASDKEPKPEKEKKEKKDEPEQTCFVELGHVIYHQTTQGFVNQNGEIFHELLINDKKVVPINGEEIDKGIVKLAEKPEPYGSFKSLLEDTQALIKEFVDVPDDFVKITSLYIALSWVQDRFRTIPYWRVKGDFGTGKSRAWEVAYNMCCNSIPVQGALTSAPVFRLIERWKLLTLAIDESDLNKSDAAIDIIKIINTGFEKSGNVMRCDQNNASKIQFFRTFCPKLFSMRYSFEDAATESRCLSQDTRTTARVDIPVELTPSFFERAAKIRNRYLDYRLKNYFKIQPVENPVFPTRLDGRLKQIALAFYPLCETEEERNWFNEWLITYQKKLRTERANSWAGTVLSVIIQQAQEIDLEQEQDELAPPRFVTTKTVADTLNQKYQTISKELKPMGFTTEKKYYSVGGKNHSAWALVITEKAWKAIVDRYSEIEVSRPKVLISDQEYKQNLGSFSTDTTNTTNLGG